MTIESPRQIVLVGASGGIGRALLAALLERYPQAVVHATRFRTPPAIEDPAVHWQRIDVRDERAIADWASAIERVDWLLNCAGFLHGEAGMPEKTVRAVEPGFMIENLRVNSLPTLLLARHFDAAFKRSPAPKLAAVSARVGSIEDNRLGGWYSYRMSKAALNMALRTLAIEWHHRHPRGCIAALHPGTNDTALSKPYQGNLAPAALFDPADTAASFVDLLERIGPADSGNFWAWDGARLPW